MDLLKLLTFSSLYQKRDLKTIGDVNDFVEAMEQKVNGDQ